MRSRFFLMLVLAACLSACNDHNRPMVAPKGSPNLFMNPLNQPAYVNILYTPGEKGINFNNLALLRQIAVPAGATVPIGDSLMNPDKLYLLDWHSADYAYSNFTMRLPQHYEPFKHYPLEADSTVVLGSAKTLSRLYCLDGDGKATHWQSVNAYNANGVSVWDTLTSKKYHSIYMDIVGQYYDTARLDPGPFYFKDDAINTHFSVSEQLGSFVISAKDYILTNDLRPKTPLYTTSPDSLYFFRQTPAGPQHPYFLIVKTKTVPLK